MMNNRHLPAGQAGQGGAGGDSIAGHGAPGPRTSRRSYNAQNYIPQHHQYQQYPHQPPLQGYSGHSQHVAFYPTHANSSYSQLPMGLYQSYVYPPTQTQHPSPPQFSPRVNPAHPQQPYAPVVTSHMAHPPYNGRQHVSPASVPYQSSAVPVTAAPITSVPALSASNSRSPVGTKSAVSPSTASCAVSNNAVDSASVYPTFGPNPNDNLANTSEPIMSLQDEQLDLNVDQPAKFPLPWYSVPEQDFPKRIKRRRKKQSEPESVRQMSAETQKSEPTVLNGNVPDNVTSNAKKSNSLGTLDSPSPVAQPSSADAGVLATSTGDVECVTPAAKVALPSRLPLQPAVPNLNAAAKKDAPNAGSPIPQSDQDEMGPIYQNNDLKAANTEVKTTSVSVAPSKPKMWSGLFANANANAPSSLASANGTSVPSSSLDSNVVDHSDKPNGKKVAHASVASVLAAYQVGGGDTVSFVEPRGLINTGNMCYMNAVLQVLLFCAPFYDFFVQLKKAVHSFKSETPLLDAMVMFMSDFNVIDSAASSDSLRRRLQPKQLDKYGDPFTPEFLYDVIRQLPRFASMRRGHQQDAQEFLGFLLESLHDECTQVIQSSSSPAGTTAANDAGDNGWVEVGHKQKSTITRSSGQPQVQSPVSRIFGGQLRSELHVPGLKDSVVLEPYQALQLDISSPNVRNIVDALVGLTRPERIVGDFQSPRGPGVSATKQVLIESLPPVLILHLKRFQFDASGNGTVKVWKKVGYPLELEIPKEVLSRARRNTLNNERQNCPRYKLSAVVYHHGKNAGGGHYTADVRRQDGNEWIRLDDTNLQRIRSEDVAEGGAEESKTPVGAAGPAGSDGPKEGRFSESANRFAVMDHESGDEDGWSHVANSTATKRWSSVVTDAGSGPVNKKPTQDWTKDKVAYLLFYERV